MAAGAMVPDRETFIHLFFNCPFIVNLINDFMSRFFPQGLSDEEKRIFLFTGIRPDGSASLMDTTINVLFLLEIWRGKKKLRVPGLETVLQNMIFSFDAIVNNGSFVNIAINSNNLWCRYWRNTAGIARHGRG